MRSSPDFSLASHTKVLRLGCPTYLYLEHQQLSAMRKACRCSKRWRSLEGIGHSTKNSEFISHHVQTTNTCLHAGTFVAQNKTRFQAKIGVVRDKKKSNPTQFPYVGPPWFFICQNSRSAPSCPTTAMPFVFNAQVHT